MKKAVLFDGFYVYVSNSFDTTTYWRRWWCQMKCDNFTCKSKQQQKPINQINADENLPSTTKTTITFITFEVYSRKVCVNIKYARIPTTNRRIYFEWLHLKIENIQKKVEMTFFNLIGSPFCASNHYHVPNVCTRLSIKWITLRGLSVLALKPHFPLMALKLLHLEICIQFDSNSTREKKTTNRKQHKITAQTSMRWIYTKLCIYQNENGTKYLRFAPSFTIPNVGLFERRTGEDGISRVVIFPFHQIVADEIEITKIKKCALSLYDNCCSGAHRLQFTEFFSLKFFHENIQKENIYTDSVFNSCFSSLIAHTFKQFVFFLLFFDEKWC